MDNEKKRKNKINREKEGSQFHLANKVIAMKQAPENKSNSKSIQHAIYACVSCIKIEF